MAEPSSGSSGVLCDYWTGEQLRPATPEELAASERNEPRGVIVVGDRACYAYVTRPTLASTTCVPVSASDVRDDTFAAQVIPDGDNFAASRPLAGVSASR
jgi:hypothetical protein